MKVIKSESKSSIFKSNDDGLYPSYSYEDIISGKVPLNQIEVDKIEVRIVINIRIRIGFTILKYT